MTEDRIVDRVRKMLALANDSAASEGERDNALRMAYNLIAKYGIDMSRVEAKTREADDPRGKEVIDSWSMLWAKQVFHAVADLFFCKYYYGSKINSTKCRHNFVGRASNTTTASLMGEYIVTSILRECRKRYVHNLAPESRAFALGAAAKIRQRVEQLIKDKKTELEATPGTALVLANLYTAEEADNDAFIRQAGTALVTKKARASRYDWEKFNEGSAYGDTVSLAPQVGKAEESLRIK